MGFFKNLFKKNSNIADSSTIAEEEKKYYREDDYYTITTHKGTPFEYNVIPFSKRKRTSIPSKRGLYIPEILMLSFCKSFPNPKNGYPAYWWFQYGVRDVGKLLKSLEDRGFIEINSKTGKYITTSRGEAERRDNAYVEYTHKHSKLSTLTAWDMNRLVNKNPKSDWMTIFSKITGQPKPIEKSDALDKYNKEKKTIKKRIPVSKIKNKNDFDRGYDKGHPHFLKGEQFRKIGYIYSAIDEFDKARANGYSAPALYWSYAMAFRKIKDYKNEVEILIEAFDRKIVGPKAQRFIDRLDKARKLKNKNKRN